MGNWCIYWNWLKHENMHGKTQYMNSWYNSNKCCSIVVFWNRMKLRSWGSPSTSHTLLLPDLLKTITLRNARYELKWTISQRTKQLRAVSPLEDKSPPAGHENKSSLFRYSLWIRNHCDRVLVTDSGSEPRAQDCAWIEAVFSTYIQFGDDQVPSVLSISVDHPEAELIDGHVQVGVGIETVDGHTTRSWKERAVHHCAVQQVHLQEYNEQNQNYL